MTRFVLSTFLLLAGLSPCFAQTPPIDLKGKTLAETFTEALTKISGTDAGQRNAAQQQWQELCLRLGATDADKLRSEACKLMAAKLDEKTPVTARIFLLQQLERIGGDESLDAIVLTVDDKDDVVREAAVRALANNPSTKSTGKLVEKLVTAEKKVGLLNALGFRGDEAAVNAISKELASKDETTAVAAARALGRMPNGNGAKYLTDARAAAKGATRAAINNALIAQADQLAVKKDLVGAAAIYKALNTKDETRPVRLGALRGQIQTAGDKAGDLILETLAGDDTAAQAVAIGQIEGLSAAALKPLAASMDKVPVSSRVLIITSIAARGDRTLLPIALAAAKSTEVDVRRAGLLALGRLGDATAVEPLLEVASGKDALAGIAAESIGQLAAEGVDAKLIAVLDAEKTPAKSAVLIGILERRKAAGAVPTLLKSASSDDIAVRTAAFAALKTLATPDDVAGMVAAFLKTEKGKDREPAELAIAAVSIQNPKAEKRAEPVLAAIKNAKERTADLFPLLGRLGGPDALKALREAIAGTDPALHSAALAGIYNWPDVSANDDLLALSEKEKEAADRLKALQALIRVNTTPGERTPEERLAALAIMKKAMPLATRDDERRAIVSGLGFIRHLDTLHYVLPYLDQPTLAQAACKGVVELAHSKMLREPNKEEFHKALDRVIAKSKDKTLVDRAKQYKEGR